MAASRSHRQAAAGAECTAHKGGKGSKAGAARAEKVGLAAKKKKKKKKKKNPAQTEGEGS